MKLGLVKKLVFATVIVGLVASCINDNIEPYVPPTAAEELSLLNDYIDTLENRGLDVDTTDLGVYYVIDSVGEGAFLLMETLVAYCIPVFFLGGEIFDTSGENTYDVLLGEGAVIEGWEDGLKVFNKNSKGYLIVPSEFAYGSTGYLSVPPNTTLIFSIEMVDIKQGS